MFVSKLLQNGWTEFHNGMEDKVYLLSIFSIDWKSSGALNKRQHLESLSFWRMECVSWKTTSRISINVTIMFVVYDMYMTC